VSHARQVPCERPKPDSLLCSDRSPQSEWNHLTEVLGMELLSCLLGISATSVGRYKAAARITPDNVADRLHFLSLMVGEHGRSSYATIRIF
jgi:hypothetical protein